MKTAHLKGISQNIINKIIWYYRSYNCRI